MRDEIHRFVCSAAPLSISSLFTSLRSSTSRDALSSATPLRGLRPRVVRYLAQYWHSIGTVLAQARSEVAEPTHRGGGAT